MKSIACSGCRAALTLGNGIKRRRVDFKGYHDFVRGSTQGGNSLLILSNLKVAVFADQLGTYKVPLNSQKIVGAYSSRGSRPSVNPLEDDLSDNRAEQRQ